MKLILEFTYHLIHIPSSSFPRFWRVYRYIIYFRCTEWDIQDLEKVCTARSPVYVPDVPGLGQTKAYRCLSCLYLLSATVTYYTVANQFSLYKSVKNSYFLWIIMNFMKVLLFFPQRLVQVGIEGKIFLAFLQQCCLTYRLSRLF